MATVLFDPPYTPRQVKECYRKLERTVTMSDTQSAFWARLKDEIARVTKPGGRVVSCGYNTNGIGKSRGFELIEVLVLAHGAGHNDTLVTVEERIPTLFDTEDHDG